MSPGSSSRVHGCAESHPLLDAQIRNSALLAAPAVDIRELLGYAARVAVDVDNACASLVNLGNTCYLNALLHILARIPSVRSWCYQHQQHWGGDSMHVAHCSLCALAADLRRIA
eukprot:10544489-Karenia_brevis.AAC.1